MGGCRVPQGARWRDRLTGGLAMLEKVVSHDVASYLPHARAGDRDERCGRPAQLLGGVGEGGRQPIGGGGGLLPSRQIAGGRGVQHLRRQRRQVTESTQVDRGGHDRLGVRVASMLPAVHQLRGASQHLGRAEVGVLQRDLQPRVLTRQAGGTVAFPPGELAQADHPGHRGQDLPSMPVEVRGARVGGWVGGELLVPLWPHRGDHHHGLVGVEQSPHRANGQPNWVGQVVLGLVQPHHHPATG
jgi:hypothetical protein